MYSNTKDQNITNPFPRAMLWSFCVCLLIGVSCVHEEKVSTPNVVLIIVDDLGWKDLGVYGSQFYESPRIDRLAESGARFTQFYAASPVCSPTRASIMTGIHPARLGLTNWIGGKQNGRLLQAEYEMALPDGITTLGEIFRAGGYENYYLGKWHLGKESFMPENQGFENTYAVNEAGQPASYYWPYKRENAHPSDVPGLEGADKSSYLTDLLGDEAASIVSKQDKDPFLMVLSFYSVHTPIQAKQGTVSKFQSLAEEKFGDESTPFIEEGFGSSTRTRQDNPAFAAMVQSVDENVGKILDSLAANNLIDNTIVVLMSDNGGLSTLANGRKTAPTSNLPLRAGKGWMYEGGIRMPLIISGPRITPGVVETPASSIDILPSLTELVGIDHLGTHVDGRSLVPQINNGGKGRDLFFHFPHYHGSGNRPSGAMRSGPFKMIKWYEDKRMELYNLEDDLAEQVDLSKSHLEQLRSMNESFESWLEEVGAKMPKPNPDWSE